MTSKEFFQSVVGGRADVLQMLLDVLRETHTPYCVIGGLAVNAYAEPVVSLDLDLVVVAKNIEAVCLRLEHDGFRVERFPHSINLTHPQSDLRIQIQTDPRYQSFLQNAAEKTVLSYKMLVARKEDVLRGKLWAYQDDTRRKSKRQKDLADVLRLIEAFPDLKTLLPDNVKIE
ncbi:MAG: hypothetical protein JXB10_13135 [Pirellulales bacterium]|nr:hypothetical protein [Pirellulales bacterium]